MLVPELSFQNVSAHAGDVLTSENSLNLWTLLLVREGSALCATTSGDYNLKPGHIILSSPGYHWSILPSDTYSHLMLYAQAPLILARESLFHLRDDEFGTGTRMLEILQHQVTAKPQNYENVILNQFSALCQFLLACLDRAPNEDIMRLEQLIKENVGNISFRVSDALASVPLTPSYARQLFHQAFGCSMIEYLLDYRIQVAKNLLRSYGMPVSEVAYKCGFKDAKYFTRRFHIATGLTPSEYRQMAGVPQTQKKPSGKQVD